MHRHGSSLKMSERLEADPEKLRWLNRLVRQGEGLNLEFKAKTNFPDKIVHELIAFANTNGGTLLIGISDDGKVSGVRYPEEDVLLVTQSLNKYCWPRVKVKSSVIKVSEKKWVVVFDVLPSKRKPVRFKISRTRQVVYIRYQDKTLQASREGEGILKLKFGRGPVSFHYGEIEDRILKTLAMKRQATLAELQKTIGIPESLLSSKVTQLAAADVIGWSPREPDDLFLSMD